jgi:hypothetical protein
MVGLRLRFRSTVPTRQITRAGDFPNDDEGSLIEIDNGAHSGFSHETKSSDRTQSTRAEEE